MKQILILALVAAPLFAQDKPVEKPVDAACALITAENLKKDLEIVAGDEFEGRCTGYEGGNKAAAFLAKHYGALGLKPVGDKNDKGEPTFFQHFDVEDRRTQNVVAYFEGSDPKLKAELVIIGAHYDHVGKHGDGPGDTIWNGADDNGSGTVTLMEIARGFMNGKLSTKRSVLFMGFSGEEFGLLGSVHYTKHPIFPLADTVAMINLDMVGRNPDKPVDVGGVSSAEDWKGLAKAAAEGTGIKYGTSEMVTPGSDHFSFARVKIPAVHFFTGFHDDYHCQSDHPEKIAFDNMEKIGRFGLKLLVAVADLEKRMEFKGHSAGYKRRLGIETGEMDPETAVDLGLKEGQGGLEVRGVNEDSVAEKAGLEEGDFIVEFNGKTLPMGSALETLRKELESVKEDTDVPVVVLRDKKRVTVKARWNKKG